MHYEILRIKDGNIMYSFAPRADFCLWSHQPMATLQPLNNVHCGAWLNLLHPVVDAKGPFQTNN